MTSHSPQAEAAWSEFRDGPDYTPTDRYPVQEVFDAGFNAALAVKREADRGALAAALYPHIWNGKACACGWNMWDHPSMWHNHAAEAVIAAGFSRTSQPVQDADSEPITNEALWDWAGDLLDWLNIEDENPPSLVEGIRDRFADRFGQPGAVQDADTRCYAEDRHHEYGTCLICGFGYPKDADLREKVAGVVREELRKDNEGFGSCDLGATIADAVLAVLAVLHPAQDEARSSYRTRDDDPCPKCGGDVLRTNFTGSGPCHAGGGS